MKDLNKQVWRRFVTLAKPFLFSEDRSAARILIGILLLLMLAVNGLNIVINFVGGDFMTALSDKNQPNFYRLLWIYGGVFVVGTPVVVSYSFVKDKLAIRWRKWLTEHLLDKYLSNRNFYRLNHDSQIDNPDERLHQDINTFCTGALSFLLVILGSIVTLCSFSGILWSIYKPLCLVLVVYSIGGTIATVLYGKRLIGLNFNQLRKEADFRYSLVHVRKNVESVAFYQGETHEGLQIKKRFAEAVQNYNLLIGWQRNLGFLTTGYNYFVVIIPSLIIAPLYFAGQVKFGVITQADMAFAQVLSALSIIVTSFAELSGFVAVINRLGSFVEALDTRAEFDGIKTNACSDGITLRNVTVNTPDGRHTIVRQLCTGVRKGDGLLVIGASGIGKSSLLRAVAGLWERGAGVIERPDLERIMILPQKPYMSLGTLRAQLMYPRANAIATDEELLAVLNAVNLGDLVNRVDGLEAERDWSEFLSVGEQQRLSFARVLLHKPEYAILDEATSGLDLANEERLYAALKRQGTTFVSVGHRASLVQFHSHALELMPEAQWKVFPLNSGDKGTYPQFFETVSPSAVAQTGVM